MTLRGATIVVVAAFGLLGVTEPSLAAKACRGGTTYVANWGCLSNRVIAQAKRNCRFGPAKTSKWTECLCQDGNTVGACGD